MHFQAKQPGVDLRLSSQEMRFRYSEAFHTTPPEAYETLLLDVIRGDATLFMRVDQVECAWGVIAPVLDLWSRLSAIELKRTRIELFDSVWWMYFRLIQPVKQRKDGDVVCEEDASGLPI